MAIELKPVGTRVVVKMPDGDILSSGGIYVPERARENAYFGTIIAAGKGAMECEEEFKVGDRVTFSQYSGWDLPYYGEHYRRCRVMNAEDILCKMEGEEEYGTNG